MEFTAELISANLITVEDTRIHLKSQDGFELVMNIGDPVANAVWTDHNKLLVALKNGTNRLYKDQINFDHV